MKERIETKLQKRIYQKKRMKRIQEMILFVAVITLVMTGVMMAKPASTATPELICGMEEHTHTDHCYTEESVLICEEVETEEHVHSEECYQTTRNISCEQEVHVHDENCYEQGGVLTAEAYDGTHAEVSYEAGVIHDGTLMTITQPDASTQESAEELIRNTLVEQDKAYTLDAAYSYQLDLVRDGEEVEPEGEVNVTFSYIVPITASSEYALWNVYHITDDGMLEDLSENEALYRLNIVKDSNDRITGVSFTASSFSSYILTELHPVISEENDAAETETTEEIEEVEETADSSNKEIKDEPEDEDVSSEAEVNEEESSEEVVESDASWEAAPSEDLEEEENIKDRSEEAVEEESEAVYEAEIESGEEEITFFEMFFSLVGAPSGSYTSGHTLTKINAGPDIYLDFANDTATYNGSVFTAALKGTFEFDRSSVTGDQDYYYNLPSEVYPPSSYNPGTTLQGYDENGRLGFTYSYEREYDSQGNAAWKLKIKFLSSYLSAETTGDQIRGSFQFSASLSGNHLQDDKLYLFDKTIDVYLDPDKITNTDPGKHVDRDISVTKTGSFSAEEGVLKYEVTVSSEKGTKNTIDINDMVTLPSSLNYDGDISSVTITKKSGSGNQDISSQVTVTKTAGSSSQKGYQMTLPALEAGESYVLSYSVPIQKVESNIDVSASNEVKASSGTEGSSEYIIDSTTSYVSVKYSYLEKYGSIDNDTGVITWTVTVNTTKQNLKNWTFTDSMLQSGTQYKDYWDFTITDAETNQTVNPGSKYSYTDGSSPSGGIKFGDTSSKYVITYKTSSNSSIGGTGSVSNKAELKPEGGTGSSTTAGVTGGQGSIGKTVSAGSMETDGDNTYRLLNWTLTMNFPKNGGIAEGTVFFDSFKSDYYKDVTNQWYSTEQMKTLYDAVNTAFGKCGIDNSSNDVYSFEVYSMDSNSWVTVTSESQITAKKYTAWRATFKKSQYTDALKYTYGNGTPLTISYTTTADITKFADGETDSISFDENRFKVGNLESRSSYTEETNVLKMDVNDKTGTTSTTSSDGLITWKIKVKIPADDQLSVTFEDYLPAGLTVNNIYLRKYTGSYGAMKIADNGALSGGENITNSGLGDQVSGSITTNSDGSQKITVKVTRPWGGSFPSDMISDDALWMIVEAKLPDDAKKNGEVSTYTNKVVIKTNDGTPYGEAEQTQNITYNGSGSSDTPGTTEDEVVTKSAEKSSDDNRTWNYSVVLNPEEKDLLEDSDVLEFKDLVSVRARNDGQDANIFPELDLDSVKFYKIKKDDEGNLVKDSSNKYQKGSQDKSVKWTYSQETTWDGSDQMYGYRNFTITANVADETAYIVEYTYHYNVVTDEVGTKGYSVRNTAQLNGQNNSGTKDVSFDYDAQFSAEISSGGFNYNLIKVEAGNYGERLEKAVFQLMKWNGSSWEKVKNGQFTTDKDGYILINRSKLEDLSSYSANTMYYLYEVDAPSGYTMDSSKRYYFYWSADGGTVSTENNQIPEDAVDIAKTPARVYAENIKHEEPKKVNLKIRKSFTEMSSALDIYFQIWKKGSDGSLIRVLNGEPEKYYGQFKDLIGNGLDWFLNSDYLDNGQWVREILASGDEELVDSSYDQDGNRIAYQYYVVETGVNGNLYDLGDYTPSYTSDTTIQVDVKANPEALKDSSISDEHTPDLRTAYLIPLGDDVPGDDGEVTSQTGSVTITNSVPETPLPDTKLTVKKEWKVGDEVTTPSGDAVVKAEIIRTKVPATDSYTRELRGTKANDDEWKLTNYIYTMPGQMPSVLHLQFATKSGTASVGATKVTTASDGTKTYEWVTLGKDDGNFTWTNGEATVDLTRLHEMVDDNVVFTNLYVQTFWGDVDASVKESLLISASATGFDFTGAAAVVDDTYTKEITLDKTNDWSETISSLPLYENGYAYRYYIREKSFKVNSHEYQDSGESGWLTTYLNMSDQTEYQGNTYYAIRSSSGIEIVNSTDGYKLPETGGSGRYRFYLIGALLIALSYIRILFLRRGKRRRIRSRK